MPTANKHADGSINVAVRPPDGATVKLVVVAPVRRAGGFHEARVGKFVGEWGRGPCCTWRPRGVNGAVFLGPSTYAQRGRADVPSEPAPAAAIKTISGVPDDPVRLRDADDGRNQREGGVLAVKLHVSRRRLAAANQRQQYQWPSHGG